MNGIKSVFVLLGILCSIYGILRADVFSIPIWLIPFAYSVGMFFCKNILIVKTPGILTLYVLMFLRYVFTPFVYYNEESINSMVITHSYLAEGLILMLYELIAIFITLEITGKKQISDYYNFTSKYRCENIRYILQLKNVFIPIIIVLFILVYIGIAYKSLGQGLSAFIKNSYNELDDIESPFESGQGYINIIWQSLCVWLYTYLVMKEKNDNDYTPSYVHVVRSVIYTIILVLLTFIDSTGITRWFTLVTAIASFSCLMYLFPTHKKSISIAILVPLTALMFFASIVKNGGYVKGTVTMTESAEGTFGATNMDVYLNGLGNVNAVFDLENNADIDFTTIFIDITRSMPVVNHYVPVERASTIIYHKVVGRDDQILPLIGQSYTYFGFLFAPLLSIFVILVVRWLDMKFYFNNSYKKYAYAFAAVWIAASPMCHNLSLIFMWLFIRIIPFLFVLSYTDKIARQYNLTIKQ